MINKEYEYGRFFLALVMIKNDKEVVLYITVAVVTVKQGTSAHMNLYICT